MTYKTILSLALIFALSSCNNESVENDPVQKADSLNEAKMDAPNPTIGADEETVEFLVKAADGGMAEVNIARLGEEKAVSPEVKRYAEMMVYDHSAANNMIQSLAKARNISLPMNPSAGNTEKATSLASRSGRDFDKAFMDIMIDDHENTIDLFKEGQKESGDAAVKTFIGNIIPKLELHLDSAKAIRKLIR